MTANLPPLPVEPAEVGPLAAMDALETMLAKHDGTRAVPRGPFGPWVCYCGAEVGDRFGWVFHVSAAARELWTPTLPALTPKAES